MLATATWARKYWLELLWGLFAVANLIVLIGLVDFETVPFHFVWLSLTLVYGYRLWTLRNTLLTLVGVCIATAASLGWVVTQGPQGPDELTEVPLMGAMFLAMVWHAERRRMALEQVRKAAEREHDFLRDASHQLKTPITIARAHAELMRRERGGEVELDVISDELRRLSTISEGLLFLTATETCHGLATTTVETRDVIQDLERRWAPSADRSWHFECRLPLSIRADRARLDAALDALLQNALEATDAGDGVTVSGYAERNAAVFEVSDTGVGVPAEFVPKVFDRFWSVRRPGGQHGTGTGLGLPIVKAVAEAHGGDVSVMWSQEGLGTAFVLRLPGAVERRSRLTPQGPRDGRPATVSGATGISRRFSSTRARPQ